jgi:hypothetical protein
MTVREALATLVCDGDYISSDGFGTNRISTASKSWLPGGVINRVDVAYVISLEAGGFPGPVKREI